MTGLSYLLSIIAVLFVIRWTKKVEKAVDPEKAIHDGLIGTKENEERKMKTASRPRAPWDAGSLRDDQGGDAGWSEP